MSVLVPEQKKTTAQVTVPYRMGEKTSKVSIQPVIYESLLNRFGSKDSTRSYIKDLAIEANEINAPDISLFVQSKALVELLPKKLQKNLPENNGSFERSTIRYSNSVTNKQTKLTTLSVLVDILDTLYDGKGNDIHKGFANLVHKNKAIEANIQKDNTVNGEKKRCDVSHLVRERIITNVLSAAASY